MDPLRKIQTRLSLSHNKVRLLQVAWAHMKSNYLHCGIHWNRKKSCGRPTVKSTWRQHLEEKAGEQWLKTCSKRGEKKNTRVELMEGTTALKQSTCKTKRRNKHLEKERKKIVHVHLYTQNTNENLLTDDKDASAKVYNICSKSLHSFTNSLLFSWICQDSERISNSRLLWTSFCDEQLNQQPCDRCLVTKDSVLAGMLVLHTLLSSRVSADLNLIT